ncbi:L-2-hydroxyglutarate oxidase [Oceaniserpentilla sp. 4NH20-0058]|uniref:L-2-hydroxyglutarate oxidase n=1 Tax=Oceaniserpentilla sp. 4NH20-0058 TaxID=3127660 RepID=UPI00333FEACF
MKFDYIIIGGGIVGVSTAWQLQQQYPTKRIAIIEKESTFACHQTGHNSGVIHAGVYYQPGSLKAQFCKQGVQSTIEFCIENNIPYEQCGKLIVATNGLERERMLSLYERCAENSIDAELLSAQALKKLEPNINGLGAILVKQTGIVNYQLVTQTMAEKFKQLGGSVFLNHEVIAMGETKQAITVHATHRHSQVSLECEYLVSCSGLMADRTTKMLGIKTDFQIIPFRGEYYQLPAKYNQIVKHLIYPVPDPDLPFLGVHLTRMIDGSVTVGPNAVQGWKREGYGNINISLKDTWEMVRFAGFWRVLKNNFKTGLIETKNSWFKSGYLNNVQKYCPSLTLQDLQPYPAGIRAQAVMNDGSLVHDFLFSQSPRSLHVCNAPSPAATSAMPIGSYICEKISQAQNEMAPNGPMLSTIGSD